MFNNSSTFFLMISLLVVTQSITLSNIFYAYAVTIEMFWLLLFCMIQTYLITSNNGLQAFLSVFILVIATSEIIFLMIQSVMRD